MKTWVKVFVCLIILGMVGLVVYMKYFYDPDVSDPDNYAAFIKSFDVSDYGEPDYVGTGRQGHSSLPLSRHAYYGLDFSRDILKDAKSVEFKLQYFDENGCSREHYRIRNLDTGLLDSRMDRADVGGIHGKMFSICSSTYKHVILMPNRYNDQFEFEKVLAAEVEELRSNHLFIVGQWNGADKIVLYDRVDKLPIGYYYDIVVDPVLPDYLFDDEDVYEECVI